MINETTEGQEAGEQREELFFKVIEAGNKILEILAALFIILMLLYGAYSLWDTCQINRRAFISGELMKYKPAGKTDESPSLQEVFFWIAEMTENLLTVTVCYMVTIWIMAQCLGM